jgi:hypothetical protein
MPSDQMSVRLSTLLLLRICSGEIYCGEPITAEVAVRLGWIAASSLVAFEIPKSSTLTSAEPTLRCVRKRFAGFRSRCTIPSACASAIASHACST